MISLEIDENNTKAISDLGDYLNLQNTRVLSLVGAGGKTSLLYYLANSEGSKGLNVVALTSTQMYKPDECFAPEDGFYGDERVEVDPMELENFVNMTQMLKTAAGWNYYITGKVNNDTGKLHSPSQELYNILLTHNDLLIIEADGSKRKPLKTPRDNEPVIYDETDTILVIMGLSGLGLSIKDSCARADLVCEMLHKSMDDIITEKDIANIIHNGYLIPLRNKYPNVKILTIINQIDDSNMVPSVKKISGFLGTKVIGTVMEPNERKDVI